MYNCSTVFLIALYDLHVSRLITPWSCWKNVQRHFRTATITILSIISCKSQLLVENLVCYLHTQDISCVWSVYFPLRLLYVIFKITAALLSRYVDPQKPKTGNQSKASVKTAPQVSKYMSVVVNELKQSCFIIIFSKDKDSVKSAAIYF